MRLYTIFKLAFKNLFSHRLRTFLTVTGVTIGISSIIFLVSLGYGLEVLVTKQVANFNAFTVIDVPAANIKTISIDSTAIDKVKAFGHVVNIAPVTNLAGRIRKDDGSSTAETVISAANPDYWKLADIIADKGSLPKDNNEVVINQSILNLFGLNADQSIGKKIKLDIIVTPELFKDKRADTTVIQNVELVVSGISNNDKSPIVLMSLPRLESEGIANYSSLKVKTDQKESVESLRKQIENIGFSTEYVGDTINEISQVFSFFRIILAAFGLIALIVAALGTFNTLTISLLERIREVGLFKALGMQNRDIYKLFLAESLIIGLGGGILGMLVGTTLGLAINGVLSILARQSGAEEIQLFVTPWFFSTGVAVFSIIVGFLTGWYPSKRAVKIDPLDALRFE
jgi:putative ABC transport system permease protein